MDFIVNSLVKSLRELADHLEAGKYKCTELELMKSLEVLGEFNTELPLSKEQSCKYLNLSRSTFDTYIRNGWMPKGKKRLGFKELSWTKAELDTACEKIKLLSAPKLY